VSRYVARRLLAMVLVLFGVTLVVFGLVHITPGDPARIMLGPSAREEEVQRLRQQLGLDQPVYVQYLRWLGNATHGDLGESIVLRRPVVQEVSQRFSNTLILAGSATLFAFPLGIAIGLLSAVKRGSAIDRLLMLLATVGVSMPSFWFALALIIIFSLTLGVLPGTGMTAAVGGGGVLDIATHLVLPATALAVVPTAVIARYIRSAVLEVLHQEYVVVARAKGLTEHIVLLRHVFANVLVVTVTMLGLQIGFLLSGAVYIENVFSWPGVGQMLVDAILKRDFPLVQGGVLLVATTYVIINLATDLLYAYLDPRIRLA
jgi:peptide/nickel transport system permease protein